jgi:hypothetical protein
VPARNIPAIPQKKTEENKTGNVVDDIESLMKP